MNSMHMDRLRRALPDPCELSIHSIAYGTLDQWQWDIKQVSLSEPIQVVNKVNSWLDSGSVTQDARLR